MASDYFSGWAIRAPWDGTLWNHVGQTRAAAIMNFLVTVSGEVYDEAVIDAKAGRVRPHEEITTTARRVWRKWRRKGFMAVHVQVETCDCRVASKTKGDDNG